MFAWSNAELNAEQKAAIMHPGSVFLRACPGSGKTRALTYKVGLELSKPDLGRQFITAINYRHRAADKIKERIEDLGWLAYAPISKACSSLGVASLFLPSMG